MESIRIEGGAKDVKKIIENLKDKYGDVSLSEVIKRFKQDYDIKGDVVLK